ncbi:UDP binding domain-containing protein [Halomonas sp. Mc5H-6]|uniref:UDP binding domain-containing protein n=1 Tax=Halomonas sp. Mc5H-6 TaxID=2954500 RepID=UPI00344090CD
MREAPSRVLMESLWQAGANVQAYDPEAMEENQHLYANREDLSLCSTKEDAPRGAGALVIVSEWQSFRAPYLAMIQQQLREPFIFDGRNMFDPVRLPQKGFVYYSVGRQAVGT